MIIDKVKKLNGKEEILVKNEKEADMMIKTKKTVRELATIFGVSKSTVHKDLKYRLMSLDFHLFQKVEQILNFHKEVRHLRGGQSTKKKYLKLEI